jgi:predicted  nucleic acid-binding Zn-ribbon protein
MAEILQFQINEHKKEIDTLKSNTNAVDFDNVVAKERIGRLENTIEQLVEEMRSMQQKMELMEERITENELTAEVQAEFSIAIAERTKIFKPRK